MTQQWQFARVTLAQYLKQVEKNKVKEDNIYSVDGVLFGFNGALNFADLEILYEPYYRNLLPQSAIIDGKATLQLEPDTTYFLMCWKSIFNDETEEHETDYSISDFTTGSTGKKTLQVDEDCLYKLAKAETYYTQAPEDLVPEQ